MKIYDLSGKIADGLWNYGAPFPDYHLRPLSQPDWVATRVYCDVFEGMNSQTGTYLETPAHFLGPEKSYNLDAVEIERLIDIPTVLLKPDMGASIPGQRPAITQKMLVDALGGQKIPAGAALLISSGWGTHWFESDYLDSCPYFTLEAMEWIVAHKPFLLGADSPRWENLEAPEGIFPVFYAANILMLAPLTGLEQVDAQSLKLTVLPLPVTGTCCAPCRAILRGDA